MPPHAQLVMGPAGVGKSTYCQAMQEHAATEKHQLHVANLDPAAEDFKYQVAFDVRELITLEDVMEEMELGPNGGLIYCMEYLLENLEWLKDALDRYGDDEYLILDCPGQIELYSHVPVMRTLTDTLQSWGVKLCGVYLIDATFAADPQKFIAGSLLSLSAMVQLELPHINVLTKCDMVDEEELERVLDFESASMLLDSANDPVSASDAITGASRISSGAEAAAEEEDEDDDEGNDGGPSSSSELPPPPADSSSELSALSAAGGTLAPPPRISARLGRLTLAITSLLDDFSMVSFLPLNLNDEESTALVLRAAEQLTQYGEDLEPRDRDYD